MKRLILLRHAKAVSGSSSGDRDRVLAARGQTDAPKIGAHMRRKKWLPDLVLCSPAARTEETAARAFAKFKSPPPVESIEGLYLAAFESRIRSI